MPCPNALTRFALAALLALAAAPLRGDVLTLRTGETVEGQILEETSTSVKIDTKIANIRTTKTYRRSQITAIEHKPLPDDFWDSGRAPASDKGDDADEPASAEDPGTTADDADEPDFEEEDDAPGARHKAPPESRYVMVPVKGGIGETVTSHGLRLALMQARKRDVRNIVFVVDSPGGYVYEAVQILEVLKEFDEDLNYICLIDEGAISAASVFAAGSDRILVRSDARLGGAVAFSTNSSGAAEVDAKFNSIWAAEVASRADSKGHPGDVFRAMITLAAELWQDDAGAFYPSSHGEGCTQLDGPGTILTLRAAQMTKGGFATIYDGDIAQLGETLGIADWSEIKGIGTKAMTFSARERADLQRRYDAALAAYRPALQVLKDNDPRQFQYRVMRSPRGEYTLDANSMREWRTRSDRSLSACNTMIKALTELASVNTKAERTKALHLFTPKDLGHEAYIELDQTRQWLSDHRNNPPAREMVNP